MYLANIFDFEHPVSICKEIIQQDINQLMEIIGFTNGNRNRQSIPYLDRLLSTNWEYIFLPTFKISLCFSHFERYSPSIFENYT